MKVFFCLLVRRLPKIYICFYISCRRAVFCALQCPGEGGRRQLRQRAAAGMTCRYCIFCVFCSSLYGIFEKLCNRCLLL